MVCLVLSMPLNKPQRGQLQHNLSQIISLNSNISVMLVYKVSCRCILPEQEEICLGPKYTNINHGEVHTYVCVLNNCLLLSK